MREMDCIDCHNRPSHIYLSPDDALDRKLAEGEIPRSITIYQASGNGTDHGELRNGRPGP